MTGVRKAGIAAALASAMLPLTARADTTVSGPISCWACNTTLYGFRVIQALYDAPSTLGNALWPILAVVFTIVMAWTIAQSFAAGISPLRPLVTLLPAFSIASVFLVSPGLLSTVTWDTTMIPVLEGGALMGNQLANATAQVIDSEVPTTTCIAMQPSDMGITTASIVAAAQMVRDNTCQVHLAISTMFRMGSIIASQQLPDSSITDKMMGKFFNAMGTMIMFSSYIAMITYALTLFETLVRVTLYACFSPFLLYFAIFRTTRGAIFRLLSLSLNLFLTLTANGIIASTMMFLLLMAMTLGITPGATAPLAPAAIIADLETMLSTGLSPADFSGISKIITAAAMTIIGASMALAIARGTEDLITEITQVNVDGSGNHTMANALTRALGGVMNLGQSAVASGLAGVGGRIGQSLGAMGKLK